jgi:hypothetical protein
VRTSVVLRRLEVLVKDFHDSSDPVGIVRHYTRPGFNRHALDLRHRFLELMVENIV